jgi:lambda family phage portal protein
MNALDRAISYLAPGLAARRVQARVAGGQLQRYAAADPSRGHHGWARQGDGSANAQTARSLPMMRARIRELVRDDAYARRILDVLSANTVGDGIVPRAATGREGRDRLLQQAWAEWAETTQIDVEGVHDVYGLQALAHRAWKESGEVFLRALWLAPAEARARGLRVPLQFQILEADYLAAFLDGRTETTTGNRILQGVEVDREGRRVAYHFYKAHPGDTYQLGFQAGYGLDTTRVPASDVVHLYKPTRPGQVRGVPEMHAVALKIRALQDYHEAQLFRAKIEACLAAFVTSSEDGGRSPLGQEARTPEGDRVESFEPGMVGYLRPGEDVKFMDPSGSGGHAEYSKQALQAIAVGAGLTYDQLTGDLTSANYSSLRAGKIEVRRRTSQEQWQVMVPRLCEPIWRFMVFAGETAGLWGRGSAQVKWAPPRHEPIDPYKDAQADLLQVRAGFKTLNQAIAESGFDPGDQLAEIASANAELDRLNLVLESDPRRTSRSGVAQAPADPDGDSDQGET